MIVGIDALPLLGRGGISRHLSDLFPALVSQGTNNRYHLFARTFRMVHQQQYQEATKKFSGPTVQWHQISIPDRLFEWCWTKHNLVLPGTTCMLRHMDVFLATCGMVPPGAPCPTVGIVHDLVPLRFPQWFEKDIALLRLRLEKLVQRSRLLIAISENTSYEMQALLGVPAKKIRVIHHGIHPRFERPSECRIRETKDAFGITAPYLLHVGGLGPIKNVSTLLSAFRIFQERHGSHYQLCLAGSTDWGGDLLTELRQLKGKSQPKLLGFLDDVQLSALYAGAAAVVLPSWHESFGFPALEAMACGAPVVAARVGALPDLLHDAALFFSPDAACQLAGQLHVVVSDGDVRRQLLTKGRKRASEFTWERTANQTLQVLEEAAKCN